MTQRQVNHIRQFCKDNKLPQPSQYGKGGKCMVKWNRLSGYAYRDYAAAMSFLVSLIRERESRS